MAEILITGHGSFASGLASAAKLIAGSLAEVHAVDFDPSQDIDKLRGKMKDVFDKTSEKEVLILSDLLGGTPFNVASMLKEEQRELEICVLAGTNLAMLLEAVFSRSTPLGELVKQIKTAGSAGIGELEQDSLTEVADEDGI